MKKQNDGGDAFPTLYYTDGVVRYPGMSKREVYAKDAMKGLLSSESPGSMFVAEEDSNGFITKSRYAILAEDAVKHADALIEALKK